MDQKGINLYINGLKYTFRKVRPRPITKQHNIQQRTNLSIITISKCQAEVHITLVLKSEAITVGAE